MVRKSISLCMALCLSIVLILPGGGLASASGVLTPDTIITNENVYQVIEYLGLDPRDLKKSDTDDSIPVTVGELEQALNQSKQLPKEVTSTENLNKVAPLAASSFCTGFQNLYYTTNLGGSFELSYEVGINYSWNKYTSVNSATVSVIDNDDNALTSFTIASKDVGANVIDSGNKVELKATVKVDSWFTVAGVGLIKLTTTTVKTSKEWTTTSIPSCT
ncbi:hypothetical protein M5X00_05410 [Paenibacillus alvei]|uniref:hypothetical protein n=1 Tax=Paenibacillus alvei TaxID=44250 RepID=UPI0002885B34|nr:hypothetical protein [Paenibacillus alvei]EJW13745.1 hypothetical protein PAV_14p00050 [Paenibacillus alvei DSM 29]MCY9542937.1 hypothetical protein [Paenibacillus alvei]MCY9702596.1 hypothetical protein [Paenibacillus alvei]MCY9732152.1 hypothetical protein [Paenibacillus alvei]MCY9753696.1 hypothetical protein [Paenibacillus alvei]